MDTGSKSGASKSKSKRKVRRILRDNILSLTDNAIKRLAHKGGAKALSSSVYEVVRSITKNFLEQTMKNAVEVVSSGGRLTLKEDDILYALEVFYKKKVYDRSPDTKRCKVYKSKDKKGEKAESTKTKRGSNALSQVRYYQKQSECVHFNKSGFKRLVREIAQDFKTDLKFHKEVFALVQVVTEDYIVELLTLSVAAAVHAGRQTLIPKDIHFIMQIRKEYI
jgi:histone H3